MDPMLYVVGVGFAVVALLILLTRKGQVPVVHAPQDNSRELARLSSEKAKIEADLNHSQLHVKNLEKELLSLKSQLDASSVQILNFTTENASLKTKTEEGAKAIAEVKRDFDQVKLQLDQVKSEREDKAQELAQKAAQLEGQNGRLSEFQSENKRLLILINGREDELKQATNKYMIASASLDHKNKQVLELQNNIEVLKGTVQEKEQDLLKLKNEKAAWEATREKNLQEHQTKMNELSAIMKSYENDKIQLRKEEEERQKAFLKERELEWRQHEIKVETTLATLAKQIVIDMPKSYPFAGDPDNFIMIKNQYVIFDAKAPKHIDSPENIDKYVIDQAKKLNKYTKEAAVRKELFLVVPDGALPFIKNFYHDLDGKKVFVIPVCALEPIIQNMKLIEDYEFAERLSPEDRENIIQFIGKSVYTMKRKIQVDQAFSNKFFDLLNDRKSLPEEFLRPAEKKETTMTVSLPQDRYAKVISEERLKEEAVAIEASLTPEEFPPLMLDDISKKVG